jgi:hypothetical protein
MNKSVCCDTGRHLDKEQIPDGTHKPTLAPTLKKEQAPDIEKSINSGMVEKSHGAVQKEAGSKKGPGKSSPKCKINGEDKEASLEDIKKAKAKKEDEKAKADIESLKKAQKSKKKASEEEAEEKEEAQKLVEEAKEGLEEAKEKLEEAREEEEKAEKEEKDATTSSIIDGIELMASMDEVELGADEAAKLSRLFS